MPASTSRKVTISLPEDLVSFADTKARERRSTRSAVIGDLLAELRRQELEALAREGYGFYARDAEDFAAASHNAVAESLDDDRPTR